MTTQFEAKKEFQFRLNVLSDDASETLIDASLIRRVGANPMVGHVSFEMYVPLKDDIKKYMKLHGQKVKCVLELMKGEGDVTNTFVISEEIFMMPVQFDYASEEPLVLRFFSSDMFE
jgi:hypothetical protein